MRNKGNFENGMSQEEYMEYRYQCEKRLQNKPKVGQWIIYEDRIYNRDHSGRPFEADRGIAEVIAYTRYLICLRRIEKGGNMRDTSFAISDIKVGLFKYKILDGPVYKPDGRRFEDNELDFNNLHEFIQQHIVE